MKKMAAKSKKRLSKTENKRVNLDKLQLKDVLCSICQSILIEPVTLPCFHNFCKTCFNGSVENNALCCPLCRLRIGSWLRTSVKQKNLVNVELWRLLKSKFSEEIDIKSKGGDLNLPDDVPIIRISETGEIKSEYEAELKRLKEERLKLEEKQLKETEILINKIQLEEQQAHRSQLDRLKEDEIIAKQMQEQQSKKLSNHLTKKQNRRAATVKPRLKMVKIDGFLSKIQAPANTLQEGHDYASTTDKLSNKGSPEIVPGYGKNIRNLLDKRTKNNSSLWNKENGDNVKTEEAPSINNSKEVISPEITMTKTKNIQSLPVSLPYTGVLRHKKNIVENRNMETSSVDSMRLELCYFKPIDVKTPPSSRIKKGLPLRVPSIKLDQQPPLQQNSPPTRSQYLDSLCRLRNTSLNNNLPSAFVIALNLLQQEKDLISKCETVTTKSKTPTATNSSIVSNKKSVSIKSKPTRADGVDKFYCRQTLRRTRSMGSISKDENETTPKKAKIKDRKASSDRKPYLRSDSRKTIPRQDLTNLPLISESINNNKVIYAVRNLSSPFKNCDVKKIFEEQLRIEKIIEQEKSDFEFAREIEAELNGRRQLRRSAVKRQVKLNYSLRPAKKLKV